MLSTRSSVTRPGDDPPSATPHLKVRERALRLWPWLAAILSGLLAAAALPPFDQAWLIWMALVPLMSGILFSGEKSRRRWLRDLGLGYVCGLTFFWISFFWIT